ncbi:MAG: hypothetical protein AB7F74_04735 [Parvibaculaceae bacterium]
MKRLACLLVISCVAGLGSHQALAQSSEQPSKLHKTIGQPSDATPAPTLVVVNAEGAKLEGKKLTLTGVQKSSIIFADRPVRAAGHVLTSEFVKSWDEGNDSFAKDPPNATVSVLGSSMDKSKDAVVELTGAKLDGDNLVFDVKVLEGDLAGASGPAALFIDHWGYHWHARNAFYAGMAVGAASASAYPYYPPPYYPPPYRCGYYPYPPCY